MRAIGASRPGRDCDNRLVNRDIDLRFRERDELVELSEELLEDGSWRGDDILDGKQPDID